ncbi:MAG: sporulation protein YqfD [Ruminococcus sp.]|nr:sporulation protein YqfD [Ruminococcus sp.]
MKNQFRGCVKINGKGKNLYGFVNTLHSRKIPIFSQYIKGGVLSAEIYHGSLDDVREAAEEWGIELTHFEYGTISENIRRRKGRFGLILGIFLILGASFYFSSIIVTIDIQGNETVSDGVILNALGEIGIEEGTNFGQINYIWSENQLRLMLDKIAWVGMHRTGHRLVVEVTEVVEKPKMLIERVPCNVVAAREAEIVSVLVRDGQLMHMVGDYVFEGDMLINGITTDQNGTVVKHHAMGEIIGKYTETVEFSGTFTNEQLLPTGKTDNRRSLKLFSLDIPLYFGKNSYEYSENELSENSLYFFEKKLPIGIKTTKYRELDRITSTLSEAELKEQLMEKIYLYEKNFLQDCEIISRDIKEEITDEGMTLRVTYKLQGDICEQREIPVK